MTQKLLIVCFLWISVSWGQTKFFTVKQHTIVVDIPKKWIETEDKKLPFYLIPKKDNGADKNFIYLYIYSIEEKNPNLNQWINNNNTVLKNKNENIKIDSMSITFKNLKKDNYLTGRHKIIIYEYPNKRKEAQLVIETKKTIITVTLSGETTSDFRKYFRSYKKLIKSLKISFPPSVMENEK